MGAIASVTQDAGQKAANAKQQVQDVTSGKYRTAANATNSKLLQNFWKPGGTRNPDNEAKLKQWMTNNAISTNAGEITMFINLDMFAAARAKAVKDLDLDIGS